MINSRLIVPQNPSLRKQRRVYFKEEYHILDEKEGLSARLCLCARLVPAEMSRMPASP